MTIHIVGAGLAGLSAAVELTRRGVPCRLYEAAPRAGGRCRSFHDPTLDAEIDNGAHVVLGGNQATFDYLALVGAADGLVPLQPEGFPFLDLPSAARWSVHPNRGRLPWWLLDGRRRPPGVGAGDIAWAVARLLTAAAGQTVEDRLADRRNGYERLWTPLTVAALNTLPQQASARLLATALGTTFMRGGDGARPHLARRTLAASLVDPAVAWLAGRGVILRTESRLKQLSFGGDRITALRFADEAIPLGTGDGIVLALPWWGAAELLPEIPPLRSAAIVNLHYRWPYAEPPRFLGLLGGTAEWLFQRDGIASVTVSAADRLLDQPADELARRVWGEIAAELGAAGADMPAVRVIKERRATIAQDPETHARRPPAGTRWANLALAGDWTATGLPATIEGAIRSGLAAARVATGCP